MASTAVDDSPSDTYTCTCGLAAQRCLISAIAASSNWVPRSGRVRYSSFEVHLVWTVNRLSRSSSSCETSVKTASIAEALSAQNRSSAAVV